MVVRQCCLAVTALGFEVWMKLAQFALYLFEFVLLFTILSVLVAKHILFAVAVQSHSGHEARCSIYTCPWNQCIEADNKEIHVNGQESCMYVQRLRQNKDKGFFYT